MKLPWNRGLRQQVSPLFPTKMSEQTDGSSGSLSVFTGMVYPQLPITGRVSRKTGQKENSYLPPPLLVLGVVYLDQ